LNAPGEAYLLSQDQVNGSGMAFPSMLRYSTLGSDKDVAVKLSNGKGRLSTKLSKLNHKRIGE
jgi:hypothetical protein